MIIHILTCLLERSEEAHIGNLPSQNENSPKIHNEHIENPLKMSNEIGERIQHFLKYFRHKLDVIYAQNPSVPVLELVNSSLLLSLSLSKEDFSIFKLFLR